jgi:two-component system sensor histidine kinase and response regulator WspE
MKARPAEDLSSASLLDLFRSEAEAQVANLTAGLLELERGGPDSRLVLEKLMRAAHSMKGAARIVNHDPAVGIAHAMEDCFVAAQKSRIRIGRQETDILLKGVDALTTVCKKKVSSAEEWTALRHEAADFIKALRGLHHGLSLSGNGAGIATLSSPSPILQPPAGSLAEAALASTRPQIPGIAEDSDRVVRLTAENLNRLLGLAGESLVESRWLRPFSDSLQRVKRQHVELTEKLDGVRRLLVKENLSDAARSQVNELAADLEACKQGLSSRTEELDVFDRRSAQLSHRLYLEVLRTRMRPFSEGVRRFPRMVRDLAHALGKEIRLEISGESTQVDRDILERLETPLAHLIRNAVDHGCETADLRRAMGKSPEGIIRLEARHSAGMLMVTVADDGPGVDCGQLRRMLREKNAASALAVETFSDTELLEFLFLPGFSMKEKVTEISGRGVGLDVVQNMVKSVRGSIRMTAGPGQGFRIQLQLPLTLSVLRALLVEVCGEAYALPLTQISRTARVPAAEVEFNEGRAHVTINGQAVALLPAHQVLDCGHPRHQPEELSIVLIGERNARYGLIVDRFLGERELVVQALDRRLGKVRDISAAALMEDGSPVLIVDVEDVVESIERLISSGALSRMQHETPGTKRRKSKRILAVDDSVTMRELEQKLLDSHGYLTDVAVDGVDGWNAVQNKSYDLVITDVDMPRMDGIELAALIKKDPGLKSVPVMIISYKDHQGDRQRGLDAGAERYFSKGEFDDEAMIRAVEELIGGPEA